MRSSRSQRIQKKEKKMMSIVAQLLAICYGTIALASYLTTGTEAHFRNNADVNVTINVAEYWWDRSDLEILGKGNENISYCAPIEISIEVKNNGLTMTKETKYEIYYVNNGNPQQHGTLVSEGIINPIESGGVVEISYDAYENGSYQFKVYQLEGYKNKEEQEAIWSKKIMVKCNSPKNNVKELEIDETLENGHGKNVEVVDDISEEIQEENETEVDHNELVEDNLKANIEEAENKLEDNIESNEGLPNDANMNFNEGNDLNESGE